MSNLPVPPPGKFYDLNLPYDNAANTKKKLSMLADLGYEVVALSTFVESNSTSTKSKKKKFIIPEPPPILEIDEKIEASLKAHNKTLMQYKRLTIELKELEDLHKVRDALAHGRFDIIAVLPRTEKLFHSACTELHVDVVCIDGSEKLGFVPRHNVVMAAISRGIFFELCYSPMIRDNTIRRLTIANAQRLVEFSKGKNVILSSNALAQMELRGPYDVANLNTLFGVKENLFIHTVSRNCRAAVVHGFSRKTAKCAVFVQKLKKVSTDEVNEDKAAETSDAKDDHKFADGFPSGNVSKVNTASGDKKRSLFNTDKKKTRKKKNAVFSESNLPPVSKRQKT